MMKESKRLKKCWVTRMIYNDFVLIYSATIVEYKIILMSCFHNSGKSESELCALLVCSQSQYCHVLLKFR